MSVYPEAEKSQPKSKADKKTEPLNPVLTVKQLSKLEKWKETDLTKFLKCISEYPCPRTPEDAQQLSEAVVSIPKEQRARAIFTLIHQDYLDFIEGKRKRKFNCISLAVKQEINEFLSSLFDLETHQTRTLELPSELEELHKLFSEKLSPPINQATKNSLDSKDKASATDYEWGNYSRLDRLRFLYSAVICINDLNSRNDAKLPLIYEAVNLLISIFLNPSEKEFKKDNVSFRDKEIAKHKLKILFDELQERSSERQLKALYDFERPNLERVRDLTWNNEELQRVNRSLNTTNENLRQQMSETEASNKGLSSQIEEYVEEVRQLKEKVKDQESAYAQLQETGKIQASQTLNSELNQLKSRINHEFEKLQRGIDKYISDEKVKSQFSEITSKIENLIRTNS
ncbi:MAG: hypothetical protein HY785_17150 [Oscillatoriophycideae cyanobacterium NC_groundwater_1537_Pr4_S-0.65um_50_18]|nr:hypothetical protein [Oscillatoriophycideae cyanobacterium NC_groundwater_1537_Pr4_S-0.65um_50_18]